VEPEEQKRREGAAAGERCGGRGKRSGRGDRETGIEGGKGGGEKVYSIKATTTGCCIMAQIGKKNEWHEEQWEFQNGNFDNLIVIDARQLCPPPTMASTP
jgi:hypothetical protein